MTNEKTPEAGSPSDMTLVTLPVDQIQPYWRNPRDIEHAVPKVLASIERFGYQAPIIVDAEHVIIVGHTRYAALRQLGWSEIPVLVSDMEPQAAQEYRIVDNKTSEYATWNPDLLLVEVRQAHEDVAEAFFPDIDLSIEFAAMAEADLGEERVEKAQVQMETKYQDGAEERIQVRKVTCPGCYQTFEIEG